MSAVRPENLRALAGAATLYKDSNFSLKYLVEDIKLTNLAPQSRICSML